MMIPKKKWKEQHKKYSKKVSEDEIQQKVEEYLNSNNISYIRIPSEAYESIFLNQFVNPQQKSKIANYLRGIPDLTILLDNGKYVCIELKKNGGKQSLGQKQFARKIGSNYHICYSLDDVITVLNSVL